MILRIPPYSVACWWPSVRGWIGQAVAHDGLHTVESTYAELTAGQTVLWAVYAPGLVACAITEVRDLPTGLVLAWCIVGGEGAADWFGDLDATLSAYGRGQGCTSALAFGRRGWAPMVKPHGWAPQSTIYTKELGA